MPNRIAIKVHGQTVYEYTTGHRMKVPLCALGELVLWRTKRHVGALNKWDSEWSDGIFLDVSGTTNSVIVGTASGIFKTQDYRRSPDGRWNLELVNGMATTFEEYICPTSTPSPVRV